MSEHRIGRIALLWYPDLHRFRTPEDAELALKKAGRRSRASVVAILAMVAVLLLYLGAIHFLAGNRSAWWIPLGPLLPPVALWVVVFASRNRVRQALLRELALQGEPVCTSCGYDVRGLAEPRCPECGTPFDPRLLSSAADHSPMLPD